MKIPWIARRSINCYIFQKISLNWNNNRISKLNNSCVLPSVIIRVRNITGDSKITIINPGGFDNQYLYLSLAHEIASWATKSAWTSPYRESTYQQRIVVTIKVRSPSIKPFVVVDTGFIEHRIQSRHFNIKTVRWMPGRVIKCGQSYNGDMSQLTHVCRMRELKVW